MADMARRSELLRAELEHLRAPGLASVVRTRDESVNATCTIIMPQQGKRRGHLYKPQPAFSLFARAMALVTAAHKVKFVYGVLKLKLASLTVKNSPQVDQMTGHKP
ncbi:hypothetical protein Tco_1083793 [Tanacetum coccineum]